MVVPAVVPFLSRTVTIVLCDGVRSLISYILTVISPLEVLPEVPFKIHVSCFIWNFKVKNNFFEIVSLYDSYLERSQPLFTYFELTPVHYGSVYFCFCSVFMILGSLVFLPLLRFYFQIVNGIDIWFALFDVLKRRQTPIIKFFLYSCPYHDFLFWVSVLIN